MQALKETTNWIKAPNTPNHTYLIDGIKLVAYIIQGTTKPIYLTGSINFNKRYRTFVDARPNPFKTTNKANIKIVKGSKGESYEVDIVAKTCTCMGFTYRASCKHIASSV